MRKKVQKLRNIYPHKKDRNNNIISYRFGVYEFDPLICQKRKFTEVWKLPQHLIGLKEKEYEHELLKAYLTYKDSVKNKAYIAPEETNDNILFMDYAREWVERIMVKSPEGYSYYNGAVRQLKLFENHFNNIPLKHMTAVRIQKFYDWLCTRKKITTTVTVKKSIQELFDEKMKDPKFRCREIYSGCGLTKTTLILIRRPNRTTTLTTAKKICNYFKVPIDKYFTVERKEELYARLTNVSARRILVSILADAKKKGIIQINFATKEYTDKITGTTREKEIYNEEEAKKFVEILLNETDKRKQIAFAIYIFMGLRSAEVCGLQWSDINFETQELSVNRNYGYFGKKFGCRAKSPKSKKSKRTIVMPEQLVYLLNDYKKWWDEQKVLHGALWQDTDYLMVNDYGKTRVGNVISSWLKQFQDDHELRRIPPHWLRHTNITMQLKAGIDIKTIAERAGHADAGITLSVYSHFLKENDKEAAKTINNLFCGKEITGREETDISIDRMIKTLESYKNKSDKSELLKLIKSYELLLSS